MVNYAWTMEQSLNSTDCTACVTVFRAPCMSHGFRGLIVIRECVKLKQIDWFIP